MRLTWAAPVLALVTACASAAPTAAPASLLTPLPPLPAATATPAAATSTPAATATVTPATPTLTATAVISATAAQPSPTRRAGRASATPSPSPTLACVNDADFLADLTVPDGSQFLPGQELVKAWSVRNTGACDWGPGYRLVFLDGDPLTLVSAGRARTEFALYPARAGAQAVWEVPMRAPDTPGEYVGRWQARDPEGRLFGRIVYIKLEVIALPGSPTAAP